MDAYTSIRFIYPIIGAILMGIILVDIFLTVFYARVGTSILRNRVGRLTWRSFRAVALRFPLHRGAILSFAGPVMLVIFDPKLGTSIQAPTGETTPHDFMTALYAAGNSMTILGAGDFSPHSTGMKLLYMFNSLIGMCMISLTLTYIMQVYSALQNRNTTALQTYIATAEPEMPRSLLPV